MSLTHGRFQVRTMRIYMTNGQTYMGRVIFMIDHRHQREFLSENIIYVYISFTLICIVLYVVIYNLFFLCVKDNIL